MATAIVSDLHLGTLVCSDLVRDPEVCVTLLEELSGEDETPATARFCFTLAQAAAFATFALELVAQGRPNCGFCGQPIDAEGHVCPRMN